MICYWKPQHILKLLSNKTLGFKNIKNSPPLKIQVCLFCEKNKSDGPFYDKKNQDFKTGKKYAIGILEKLLSISTFDAYNLVTKHKNLTKIDGFLMKTNFSMFLQNGLTISTLTKYPNLLAETNAKLKIKALKQLPFDINSVAILILLSPSGLKQLIEEEISGNNRIGAISELLQIKPEEACELMHKKPFLRKLDLKKLKINIKILTEFGISGSEICRDLWVVRYREEIIKARLNAAKEQNLEVMKTWMVRAQPDILQTYIRRRSDNKQILGNNSLAEYLSERLDCSVEAAKYLITKQPVVKNKSLKKLKEIIDLLYSRGFKPYHICRVPKILVHSTETTKNRLKLLETKGLQIDSLYILVKSQKQFTQFYENLIKTKNKIKN